LIIKVHAKNISAFTLIVTGALFAIFGMVPSIAMYVVVLMMICFFASGFGTVACPTFMANWFPRKKGIALGWATMGGPFSSAFFVSGFAILLTKYGIRSACLTIGIIVVIIGIISIFWAKNEPADVDCLPDNMELDDTLTSSGMVVDNEKYSLKNILKTKSTWLIAIGYGLIWMVLVGILSQFVPRMMSVGYSNEQALTFLTITSIIAIPGSYLWGWLDSKFGTKTISIVYAFSYIVALILLITSFNPVCVWIGCIFAGLGIGGLLNLLASMIISSFGREGFMSANSVITPIASIIRVFAFALMAMLLNISGGSFTLPYIVFIIIDIVGAIFIMLIPTKN
jgi:OFA family oxalate/formate antiporter-like MFS transporter